MQTGGQKWDPTLHQKLTIHQMKAYMSGSWKPKLPKPKVHAFLSTAQNIQDGRHFKETDVTLVPEQIGP